MRKTRTKNPSSLFLGWVLGFAIFYSVAAPPPAEAVRFSTKAPYVFLVDVESDTLLFEKNADVPMIPASMTKIVTLSLLFDQIKRGVVKMDDSFFVSINAWKKGGAASGSSTMFLNPESSVSVRDLIQGVIVSSGNDASIAIAENLAEDESTFAEDMTRFAESIGMTKSKFLNATGWPEAGHQTTAREMANLSLHQIRTFPEFYKMYSQRSYKWNDILQRNRNDLLKLDLGVDGMKTAHSSDSGYGIVASAAKDGRRLLLVVHGLRSGKERLFEARRILEWGFRAFRTYRFFKEGETILNAPVWHGSKRHTALLLGENIFLTIPKEMRPGLSVRLLYDSPLKAPIKKGTKIGVIQVTSRQGDLLREADLFAGSSVKRGNIVERTRSTLEYLFFGLR